MDEPGGGRGGYALVAAVSFIACSFHTASGSGGYGGREYYWDFSEMFGPLFTDKDGNELKKQPGPRSHAFKAFQIWHAELMREKSQMMGAARKGCL